MNERPTPSDLTHAGNSGISQGIAWISCGWRLMQGQKSLWYGMTAVYLVFGFLIKLIPFMGDLLLILITPMLLAGVVWGRTQESPAGATSTTGLAPSSSAAAWLQVWIVQPAQELARIFSHEEKAFVAVLLGIVTLGLIMLVKIAGYLLVGGSMISGLTAAQLSAPQITTLLGMLVVAALYLILTMGLFYSVPLTVLGNRQPLAAVSESFSACLKNAVPLLALVAPFFLVYLAIAAAFAQSHWLGYLLLASAGVAATPVFVASAYCSYLTLYPLDHRTPRR